MALQHDNTSRILIIDDSADNLLLIKRILQGEGYEVDIASYIPTALKKLHEGNYDLVITDFSMPEMSGDELIRKVREAGMTFPIIICGAVNIKIEGNMALIYTFDEPPKSIEKDLFDGFIQKPIDIDSVIQTVRKHLK